MKDHRTKLSSRKRRSRSGRPGSTSRFWCSKAERTGFASGDRVELGCYGFSTGRALPLLLRRRTCSES